MPRSHLGGLDEGYPRVGSLYEGRAARWSRKYQRSRFSMRWFDLADGSMRLEQSAQRLGGSYREACFLPLPLKPSD
jgi:hypothetical protein